MKVILGLFSYGGVEEGTVDSILRELSWASSNKIDMGYQRFSGDALISRSRSRVLGNFFNNKPGDVLVMVDHDVSWRPGDLTHIARKAFESGELVGGLYCKRAFKKGWASRVPNVGTVRFGEDDKLLQTDSLATGFLAIPYSAVAKIIEELSVTSETFKQKRKQLIDDGDYDELLTLHDLSIANIKDGAWKSAEHDYYDFFRCMRWPSGAGKNYPGATMQFLSEDWAFSIRALHCGVKSYLSTYPILTHTGNHGYIVSDGMDDVALRSHEADERANTETDKGPDKGAGRAKKCVRKRRSS